MASPINPENAPVSKGWLSFDRPNVSYALVSTLALALARTYAVSSELKVRDAANLAPFAVFIVRDKLDDELFRQFQRRPLGDVACGVLTFGAARVLMGMSSSNAMKYGAMATAVSLLTRYALEDNNLLKI